MPIDPASIGFRPLTATDLPMLKRWLAQPHWQKWWGDPDVELGYIIDMLEGRDKTRPYIFQHKGVDAGYIQYWRVGDQLCEPWLSKAPWLTRLPKDGVGVDLSIGDSGSMSRGLGSAVLAAFVAKLRAQGINDIFIDPAVDNIRAIRAYQKAGFVPMHDQRDETGTCHLMQHVQRDAL